MNLLFPVLGGKTHTLVLDIHSCLFSTTMSGRPEHIYALRRVITSKQTHDQHLTETITKQKVAGT